MNRHVAQVTLLEGFELGKNTGQNAGIEIRVFDKGAGKKRGPQIGTIKIGQGSFAWWAKSAKVQTKNGKRSPTVRLDWAAFAGLMEEMVSTKKSKTSKKKAHA